MGMCVCVLVNNNVEFEAHRHISTHNTRAHTPSVIVDLYTLIKADVIWGLFLHNAKKEV